MCWLIVVSCLLPVFVVPRCSLFVFGCRCGCSLLSIGWMLLSLFVVGLCLMSFSFFFCFFCFFFCALMLLGLHSYRLSVVVVCCSCWWLLYVICCCL